MRFNVIDIPEGSTRISRLDPDRRVNMTVVLAQKAPLPPLHTSAPASTGHGSGTHPRTKYFTHAELRKAHGAVSGSAEIVTRFAEQHKLTVVEAAPQRRTIRLSGRSADIERAFKTRLEEFRHKGSIFYAPSRPIEVPENWAGMVEIVLGLHNFPHSRPRRRSSLCCSEPSSQLHDLARAYRFPPDLDATGQTIGLIEFGGGFYPDDIEAFCRRFHIKPPKITVAKIGSGDNQPADRRAIHHLLDALAGTISLAAGATESDSFLAAQCTAEVTMDIEVLAALAPAAHIVTYFAPGDEQGLYHAINHAVHDEHNKPDILSISWGMPEHAVTAAEVHALEGVLHEAAHLGISIFASSGDSGATNGSENGALSVNYPASSPQCLSCGGTSGKIVNGEIHEEVVWNATHFGIKGASGGGVSNRFRIPAWQQNAQVPAGPGDTPGRGVPDVAGLADPRYGCELLMADRTFASAGTSAVVVIWAALIARINQGLGRRCGHLHPYLYSLGKERRTGLHPVLKGNNGYYHAGEGWNACAGYGTPRGDALLESLRHMHRA